MDLFLKNTKPCISRGFLLAVNLLFKISMKQLLFLILLCGLISCEQNIEFDLDESPSALVAEASIETGKAPKVILSKSLSYYSTIDAAVLMSSFIHDAEVYVSNGSVTHKLKEDSTQLFPGFFTYYYSTDSSNLATAIEGAEGETYDLRIVWQGKEYLSSTTIPTLAVVPDSVWFMPAPANPDTAKRILMIRATDPPGLGNYIRYYTKTNGEPFWPGPNSVFTDQIFDGSTYQAIFQRGFNPNNPPKPEDNFFKQGDTVTIKYCNINKATYDFWNTWEFARQAIGNPFSQPNTVTSNITGGGLGSFCGYAPWYGTYIIP